MDFKKEIKEILRIDFKNYIVNFFLQCMSDIWKGIRGIILLCLYPILIIFNTLIFLWKYIHARHWTKEEQEEYKLWFNKEFTDN